MDRIDQLEDELEELEIHYRMEGSKLWPLTEELERWQSKIDAKKRELDRATNRAE